MSKTPMTETEKAMLEAVRSDPKIGRGSCAMVDECMEDSEVLEAIREAKATTPEEAVKALKDGENGWRDVADDAIAAGGDDDFRWGQV